MPYVVSTLSAGTDYADYRTDGNMNIPQRVVTVKGGAGVAQRIQALAGEALTSPGYITEVSDEDAKFLANHPVFKQQQEAGFVKILEKIVKVEKAVKDMNEKDESRPLTEADHKKGGRIAGAVNNFSTLK